ncbi:uncharacterized protein LOC143026173 isoform X2 [Oratosquilla oratoria]|uniref:uncharacterized protein LOC143026173 isoform X2 n=1 Tax=Oratosquilla oratoria TaxID=337810 RepID=UPI003F76E4F4
MSWPDPSMATGPCLTNLLERYKVVDQCPCWCHNGYSPPCYDCAEVVCHEKTYEPSSQNMAPSAPSLSHDPVVSGLVAYAIDNSSANNYNSDINVNNNNINVNNNDWPSTYENTDPRQGHHYRLGVPRPRHPRSSGLPPSPLSSSWSEGGSSSMNNNVTTVGSTWSSTRNRPGSISSFSDIARWFNNNKPRKRSRPVSMNRTGNMSSPSRIDRADSMNLHDSTIGWQGHSQLSNVLLPTAIGTTARDTVSPDAAKWPVSRRTVYPEMDATTFPRPGSGNVNSCTDADDYESTVTNLSTNSGSISDSEQNLPSSSRFQSSAVSSDNELVFAIVGSPSQSAGDVGTEKAEEESSVFSSEEDRGRRLIEETLYPTEISGRTKPFLLWKLNL